MTNQEDISSENEYQKKLDRQWPPSRRVVKRAPYSLPGIRNAFSKGEVIINPAFLNMPESHCIIYFDEDQDSLYNSLSRKEGNPIFLISEQYFVLFQDNIQNDYLDTAQINKIKENFKLCSKFPAVKEYYQSEFEKITSDFKKVVIDLLHSKLRCPNYLLEPKNKHWQRIFAIYGNDTQKTQYNALTQQNKNPPTSTSEILESLSASEPVATDTAALNEPQLNKQSNSVYKISNFDNRGEINEKDFPANFNCFVTLTGLTASATSLKPHDDAQSVQSLDDSKKRKNPDEKNKLKKKSKSQTSLKETNGKSLTNNDLKPKEPWKPMCGVFSLKNEGKKEKQPYFDAEVLDSNQSKTCFNN